MPTYIWILIACIIALCVFRFRPVSGPDINIDIFSADHGTKPNYYTNSQSEGQFRVSAIRLEAAIGTVIANASGIKELSKNTEGEFRATYVDRSFLFGFPDFLSIKIEQLTPENAVITIFSQSKYGYSDFGVNRKRVKMLLAGLRQQLGA